MRRGDYVLCNFPFREAPLPGPTPHVVLVAGIVTHPQPAAVVYYTTTNTAFEGAQRPRRYILVDQARAKALGQKAAFHIDVTRVALLPLEPAYFPEADNRVRIFGSGPSIVDLIERRLREVMEAGTPVIPVRGLPVEKI